jgi:hypothetical protein
MVHDEPETDRQAQRTKWLKRLADELIKLEPLMPINLLPEEEDCPEWVRRVEREVGAVMFPEARIKEGFELTPGRMGALLGHECANAVWLMEWIEARAVLERKLGTKQVTEEAKQKAEEVGSSIIKKWYPGMRRLAKIALCSTVDQAYEDMTDFLLAFSKGFAAKPRTLSIGNMGNPTFEIYVFMLMYWRMVGALKSVRELHDILARVFGAHRIGELKRIEKICQRMGLHYRKPGRPRTTRIIQTS